MMAAGFTSCAAGRPKAPATAEGDASAPMAGVQGDAGAQDPFLAPIPSDAMAYRMERAKTAPIASGGRETALPAPPGEAPRATIPASAPVSPGTTNVPPPVDPSLADLIAATERDGAEHPDDPGVRKLLGHLYVLAGRYPDAARAFDQVDFAGDEFARVTYAALMNRLGEDSKATEALDAVRRSWRRAHELRLPVACFTQGTIGGYRIYTPVESPSFFRGRPVGVYVEVENFTSRQTAGGRYQVALRVDFAILDAAKREVPWLDLARYKRDYRREQMDDFGELYLPLLVILPKDLSPGAYTLALKVHDTLGEKNAEVGLPFTVQ